MFYVLQSVRYDGGHHPVGCPLLGGEVGQPLPEEVLDIEEVCRGWGEDCDIACPAEPLVWLQSVGISRKLPASQTTLRWSWFE